MRIAGKPTQFLLLRVPTYQKYGSVALGRSHRQLEARDVWKNYVDHRHIEAQRIQRMGCTRATIRARDASFTNMLYRILQSFRHTGIIFD